MVRVYVAEMKSQSSIKMQIALKAIAFYMLLGFPLAKYSGVSSQMKHIDETSNLTGPNVCKRIEEYVYMCLYIICCCFFLHG